MTTLYWTRYLFLMTLSLVTLCFVGAFLVSLVRARGK